MLTIYGIDFTSAPRRQKPITCARTTLNGRRLRLEAVERMTSFTDFEALLNRPGPWVAGFDFPFAQPRRLVEALDWPRNWSAYVALVGTMSKDAFSDLLARYRVGQPPGDKHHLRAVDVLAGSISPMMLFGVPVGKMFFAGAPRLLHAGVDVPGLHRTGDSRIALETYPALAARRWIGRTPYKNDARRKQTAEQRAARAAIIDGLKAEPAHYGLSITLDDANMLADDPTGDSLDALLCAVQAAWATQQFNYGMPDDCDPLEGWICDPALLERSNSC